MNVIDYGQYDQPCRRCGYCPSCGRANPVLPQPLINPLSPNTAPTINWPPQTWITATTNTVNLNDI